uniref:Uncharacterized protein n=1 Tax=Poecilia reticulata TaxID=8081 RepID=A0A3P9Q2D6_POERE
QKESPAMYRTDSEPSGHNVQKTIFKWRGENELGDQNGRLRSTEEEPSGSRSPLQPRSSTQIQTDPAGETGEEVKNSDMELKTCGSSCRNYRSRITE